MSEEKPSQSSKAAIVWFRDDLRTLDNPALTAAARSGRPVVGLYILDGMSPGIRPLGGGSRWWLAGSLRALGEALEALGVPLVLRRGSALDILPQVMREAGADAVYWNRRYGPAEIEVDSALKAQLRREGVEVETHSGHLLYEPWTVKSKQGEPLKVFSPFWRAARALAEPRAALPRPGAMRPGPALPSDPLDSWRLEPTAPDWAGGLRATWTPGEAGAQARMAAFLEEGLAGYAAHRDRPDLPNTSRLSPHLRFGEISVAQLWREAAQMAESGGRGGPSAKDVEKFHSELGWREFSYHLLYQFPELPNANFNARFDAFPWAHQPEELRAWQKGLTGYPIVDAGMRQLWQTGFMHNRVRMIAASFLVKDLLIDWRTGEAWFWDTLCDADLANNAASWQWVAGSGADAAPYFRVFNPVLQGQKFDPDGAYVRAFLPELAALPDALIHEPWNADAATLRRAGVRLGETYPRPIVEHGRARDRALEAYSKIKSAA